MTAVNSLVHSLEWLDQWQKIRPQHLFPVKGIPPHKTEVIVDFIFGVTAPWPLRTSNGQVIKALARVESF